MAVISVPTAQGNYSGKGLEFQMIFKCQFILEVDFIL